MRLLSYCVLLLAVAVPPVHGADQTILGSKLQVKNPSTPEKRKITGVAKEKGSTNTLVGDPLANGATLTVGAGGGTPTRETWILPAGLDPATGKPFWIGDAAKGFKYADAKGANGPVKKLQLKKSGSGVFQIAVGIDAKRAPVGVVPPNPGTDACLLLELGGGDSYSVAFLDGQVKNKGAAQFQIGKPTLEASCVVATTSTTTSIPESTTTTTESTTTTVETTTTTTTSSTTSTVPCVPAPEVCDGVDNDCNGVVDDAPGVGAVCHSDDNRFPGDGACRTTGTKVCSGTELVCSAVTADCATLPGGCTEVADGIDNDCDGAVDETFNAKGANGGFFVKPVVTQIGASLWIYSYEASRSAATATSPGRGNGYTTLAQTPAGSTLDKTPPTSAPGRLGWSNVTGPEAEQACATAGGALCTTAQAQTACAATVSCTWGYAPRTAASCQQPATGSKFCNLAAFDTNVVTAGNQDDVLPGGSPLLQSCYADWSALFGNTAATNKVFDVTGNLRELTKATGPNTYTALGGSALTQLEGGATCTFATFTVDQTFGSRDTGFRCCFTQDPRL
ncbi:MAG: putative metal-binding motif-containing protein [bacterium]|nr:putative metal-binding motif-containing protein [bacterium]